MAPPRLRGPLAVAVAACLALAMAGCAQTPAVSEGATLFASASLSPSTTNQYSCADCHATLGAGAAPGGGPRLPGATLHDTVPRGRWWGGAYELLEGAVSECLARYMAAPRLLPDDERGRALLVYLESISPDDTAAPLPLTVVPVIGPGYLATLSDGNAGRGGALWAAACSRCHGDAHTGQHAAFSRAPILPEATIAAHGSDPASGARAFTVEKVRHGNFYGLAGTMPLYSLEALADAELADLIAYLGL